MGIRLAAEYYVGNADCSDSKMKEERTHQLSIMMGLESKRRTAPRNIFLSERPQLKTTTTTIDQLEVVIAMELCRVNCPPPLSCLFFSFFSPHLFLEG